MPHQLDSGSLSAVVNDRRPPSVPHQLDSGSPSAVVNERYPLQSNQRVAKQAVASGQQETISTILKRRYPPPSVPHQFDSGSPSSVPTSEQCDHSYSLVGGHDDSDSCCSDDTTILDPEHLPKQPGIDQVLKFEKRKTALLERELNNTRKDLRKATRELKAKDKVIDIKDAFIKNISKIMTDVQTVRKNEVDERVKSELRKLFTANQTALIMGLKKRVNWSAEDICIAFSLR